jgi:hypothetical protein
MKRYPVCCFLLQWGVEEWVHPGGEHPFSPSYFFVLTNVTFFLWVYSSVLRAGTLEAIPFAISSLKPPAFIVTPSPDVYVAQSYRIVSSRLSNSSLE